VSIVPDILHLTSFIPLSFKGGGGITGAVAPIGWLLLFGGKGGDIYRRAADDTRAARVGKDILQHALTGEWGISKRVQYYICYWQKREAKMPKVKVGDINMYYEIHGEGETLVMIMGAGGNVEWYYPAIPVYSPEYRLVLYDNRGAGRSDDSDVPYTIESLADDLAGLLDVIGIESAHIFGASLGGMIAQQFVLRYPKRVRSLILSCTYCGGPGSSIMNDPEVMEAGQRMQSLSGEELMMETLRICVSQKFMDENPGRVQEMVKIMANRPMTPQAQMKQGQAAMTHNTYDRLPEIKAPTLVIHGGDDRVVPAENARTLASRIPDAELVILDNMGHGFFIEAEEEFNRITLDFLGRHRTGKA
jgi:pimeloyl-ACP methyl ester carboxylesterase